MAMVISTPGNASDMAGVPGNNKYVVKTCTFSGAYADGPLAAVNLGLESVHVVLCSADASGYVPVYDYDSGTLDLYQADNDAGSDSALIKASGTVAATVRIIAFGR